MKRYMIIAEQYYRIMNEANDQIIAGNFDSEKDPERMKLTNAIGEIEKEHYKFWKLIDYVPDWSALSLDDFLDEVKEQLTN